MLYILLPQNAPKCVWWPGSPSSLAVLKGGGMKRKRERRVNGIEEMGRTRQYLKCVDASAPMLTSSMTSSPPL